MTWIRPKQSGGGGGSGSVVGPAVTTLTALARWDDLTGTLLANSTVLLDNAGNMTGVETLALLSGAPAFSVILDVTEVLTANRTLTLALNDAARSLTIGGNLSFGAAVTTVGAFTTAGVFSTGGAFSTSSTFAVVGAFSTAAAFSTGSTFATVGAFATGGAFSTAAAQTWAGAFAFTATLTGVTAVTFPTTGTLLSSADIGVTVQGYAAILASIAALGTNGLITRTGAGVVAARTIVGGAGMTVTNGDGVAGNPTLSTSGAPGGTLGKIIATMNGYNLP